MALGNLNSLIALRTKGRPTHDSIVETFGRTAIHSLRHSISHRTDTHLVDFSAIATTQLSETLAEGLRGAPRCSPAHADKADLQEHATDQPVMSIPTPKSHSSSVSSDNGPEHPAQALVG